jgi:ferredoxin-NADP reductase
MWPKPRPRRLLVPRPNGPSKRWARGAHTHERRAVRVAAITRETADAVTVTLEPEDGKPLHFRAGQYLTHLFTIDGETLKRAYSLSSAEGQAPSFTAKMVENGRVSAHLQTRLRPGERYSVLGPSGEFILGHGAHPLLFVAGGSGITPVISLIETALAAQPERVVRLLYASRSEDDIIFRARLAALAQRHASLSVTHVLSRPGPAWRGERDRLDLVRVASLLAPPPESEAYLCGPTGLMDAAVAGLVAAAVPAARIRRERFLAAPRASAARPSAPQPIEFRRSGRTVMQNLGESILECGLREGIALDFSCTVGGCGSCKLHVVSGHFALNEPNCLSSEERATGHTLACSSYALEPLVIDA